MKKLLFSLFLILSLCVVSFSQSAPQLTRQYSFGAASTTTPINISSLNIGQIKSNFSNQSSVAPTSCTYSLQQSPDNITYTDITGQSAISCTNLNGGETPLVIIGTTWLQIKINTYVPAQASQILSVGFTGYTEVQGSSSSNPSYVTSSTTSPDNVRIQDGTGTILATVQTAGRVVSGSASTALVTDSLIYGGNGSINKLIASSDQIDSSGITNSLAVGIVVKSGGGVGKVIQASSAVSNGDSGNYSLPVTLGITNGATFDTVKEVGSTGVAVSGTGAIVSVPHLWESANNFSPQRSANGASNTTGTGLLGVNNLISDGTNFQNSWNATKADGSAAAGAGIAAAGLIAQDPINASVNRYLSSGDQNGGTLLGRSSLSVVPYIYRSNGTFAPLTAISSANIFNSGSYTLAVAQAPNTAGASSVTTFTTSGIVGTAVLIVAGTHNLYQYEIANNAGTICYLQFFDAATAGAVSVGSTTPKWSVRLDSNTLGGSDSEHSSFLMPINFSLGIVVAATTTHHNASACGSGADMNLGYQ